MAINDIQKQGSRSSYDNTSATNQTNFLVQQTLKRDIRTGYLARVDLCESKEETTGATYVSVTPLTTQTDTEGTPLPMVSIPKVDFCRYQFGIAAVVIDPVPDDIVQMLVNKNDISTIKQGVTEPVLAGSQRQFSPSDSTLVGAVHTQVPLVYIVLRQDQTIKERGPNGIRVETDKTLDEEALEDRLIHIGRDRTENIDQHQTVTIGGNETLTTKGTLSQTVQGDVTQDLQANVTLTIGADNTVTINGAKNVTINGGLTEKVGGSASIEVGGALTIKAPSITFDTPSAMFTGNVTIAGGLSQGGGGRAALAARANDHEAWFAYNINTEMNVYAKEKVQAEQDVIGAGVSLKNHIHGNGNEGADTTPPQATENPDVPE